MDKPDDCEQDDKRKELEVAEIMCGIQQKLVIPNCRKYNTFYQWIILKLWRFFYTRLRTSKDIELQLRIMFVLCSLYLQNINLFQVNVIQKITNLKAR